jgi:hypothetical protein
MLQTPNFGPAYRSRDFWFSSDEVGMIFFKLKAEGDAVHPT